MTAPRPNYAVYVKNVKTGQLKYVDSSSLLVTSEEPLDCVDFEPKHANDFTRGKYYGREEKVDGIPNTVKYYILRMAGESCEKP